MYLSAVDFWCTHASLAFCNQVFVIGAFITNIQFVLVVYYSLILACFNLENPKGDWQTVPTLIRRRKMRRPIRVSTVCK